MGDEIDRIVECDGVRRAFADVSALGREAITHFVALYTSLRRGWENSTDRTICSAASLTPLPSSWLPIFARVFQALADSLFASGSADAKHVVIQITERASDDPGMVFACLTLIDGAHHK